jgi:hypothetical protein
MRFSRRRPDAMSMEREKWRLRLIAPPVRMSTREAQSLEAEWYATWVRSAVDVNDPNGYAGMVRPLYTALWEAAR